MRHHLLRAKSASLRNSKRFACVSEDDQHQWFDITDARGVIGGTIVGAEPKSSYGLFQEPYLTPWVRVNVPVEVACMRCCRK
jgi:hypothetical protein